MNKNELKATVLIFTLNSLKTLLFLLNLLYLQIYHHFNFYQVMTILVFGQLIYIDLPNISLLPNS